MNYIANKGGFTAVKSRVHFYATRNIKYLKGTQDIGITIGGPDLKVSAYSDANLGEGQDSRSISGGLVSVGQGIPIWFSKKQTLTAQSTAESEFIALNECFKEVAFVVETLRYLGVPVNEPVSPVTVREDNQSCIAIAEKRGVDVRTKHINRRIHIISGNT